MSLLCRLTSLSRSSIISSLRASSRSAPYLNLRSRSALACAVYDDFHLEPFPVDDLRPSPSQAHCVVSLLGADRIGIISTFTASAAAAGADVVQSRMALLGGDFAIIVHVRLPHADHASTLAERLREDLPGFEVAVRSTTPQTGEGETERWRVRLDGPDRPGIVAAVSGEIAKLGGNVIEMETETSSGGDNGGQWFRLDGKVALEDGRVDGLAEALTSVEERFGASIALSYVPEGE